MFPLKSITGVFSLFLASSLLADSIYYNVTFSSPPHTVGAAPATGVGPAGPSLVAFDGPTVASQFGHLLDQPLVFTGIGYDQIQFNLGQHAPNYFIEFDFETHNLNPSLWAFTALFDTPAVQNVYLHGGFQLLKIVNGFGGLPWTDNDL